MEGTSYALRATAIRNVFDGWGLPLLPPGLRAKPPVGGKALPLPDKHRPGRVSRPERADQAGLARRKVERDPRKTVTPVARQDAGDSAQPEVNISKELLDASSEPAAEEGAAGKPVRPARKTTK